MQQARAAGDSLSNIHFTAIYASDLLRAFATAQAIHDAQPQPKPPLTKSTLLREQHWGAAEGYPWLVQTKPGLSIEDHFALGIYPVLHERWQKFPEGESLDDVVQRAERVVNDLIMPHVWDAAKLGKKGVHIALVSHGICISELIPVLIMKDQNHLHPGYKWRGLRNTAWTRITVNVKVRVVILVRWDIVITLLQGSKVDEPVVLTEDGLPPLEVKVTEFNRAEHLNNIVSHSNDHLLSG